MQEKIRVLFAGSGNFSWEVFTGLLEQPRFEVVGILTQPHKPQGRNQVLTPAYLEKAILNTAPEILDRVPIFRPERLKLEAEQILEKTKPDLMVVAAYGQIIPNVMLNFSKLGCVNFHGSLLPELRGAVPVQMAILQGLKETGVTLQRVVPALDAGAIIAARKSEIYPNETSGSLMARLALVAKEMVALELVQYADGLITPVEQDASKATYCYESDLAKEKAEIRLSTNAATAQRMVLAFNPWPVAWTQIQFQNSVKRLKILASELVHLSGITGGDTGLIIKIGKDLYLVLADGVLKLIELQLEGKTQGLAADYLFLHGVKIAVE